MRAKSGTSPVKPVDPFPDVLHGVNLTEFDGALSKAAFAFGNLRQDRPVIRKAAEEYHSNHPEITAEEARVRAGSRYWILYGKKNNLER